MDIRPTSNIVPPQALAAGVDAAPGKAPAEPVKQAGAPGKDELAQALKSINTVLQDRAPGLEFSIDKASDRSIVKVVDKDTHEVIRQMPSREAMEIAQALDKLQSLMTKQTA